MSGVLGGLFAAFPTPVVSSFESIATITAAGSETSLTFSSIPSTFNSLQLRSLVRTLRALNGTDTLQIRFNSDAGSNYSHHRLTGNGSTANAGGSAPDSSLQIQNTATVMESSLANTFAASIVDIQDYAVTTKNKTTRAFAGGLDNSSSTSFVMGLHSGCWYNTAAINSITLINSFGFKAGSVFSLYGIKGV